MSNKKRNIITTSKLPENIQSIINGISDSDAKDSLKNYISDLIFEKNEYKHKIIEHERELNKTNEGMLALTMELEQEIDRSKEIEKELNHHKNKLEELIEKRTLKILQTNELLNQEIIERKTIENRLIESKEKFQFITDNSVDVIWQMDLTLVISYISPSIYQMTGSKPEEWIGTNLRDHISRKSFLGMARKAIQLIINYRQMNYIVIESYLQRKDGSELPVEIICKPMMNENNEFIGLMGSTRDVTERMLVKEKILNLNLELEEKVRIRTLELEEINKELDAFSYSVSHDLRAPLRHIEGFAQLIAKHCDESDEKNKRYLTLISESTQYMGGLIDKLLELSRFSRKEIIKIDINMGSLVKEIVLEYKNDHIHRNIEFSIDDIKSAYGDVELIKLVWTNYISNAVKYTSKNEYAKIKIGSYTKNNFLVYFIEDNGTGFDMKYYEKLFGVFQRLHSDREYSGTGIGLANVKRIVSRHGGKVWAESKLNEGDHFLFFITNYKAFL
jgi:PAS domain S-box-containing protein